MKAEKNEIRSKLILQKPLHRLWRPGLHQVARTTKIFQCTTEVVIKEVQSLPPIINLCNLYCSYIISRHLNINFITPCCRVCLSHLLIMLKYFHIFHEIWIDLLFKCSLPGIQTRSLHRPLYQERKNILLCLEISFQIGK